MTNAENLSEHKNLYNKFYNFSGKNYMYLHFYLDGWRLQRKRWERSINISKKERTNWSQQISKYIQNNAFWDGTRKYS